MAWLTVTHEVTRGPWTQWNLQKLQRLKISEHGLEAIICLPIFDVAHWPQHHIEPSCCLCTRDPRFVQVFHHYQGLPETTRNYHAALQQADSKHMPVWAWHDAFECSECSSKDCVQEDLKPGPGKAEACWRILNVDTVQLHFDQFESIWLVKAKPAKLQQSQRTSKNHYTRSTWCWTQRTGHSAHLTHHIHVLRAKLQRKTPWRKWEQELW